MPTITHDPQLLPWQAEIAPKMRRFTVLTKGRRCGGTAFAEEWIIDGLLAGYPCAWLHLSYKHMAEVWRELLEALRPVIREVNKLERRIELLTGGYLDMWSSEADVSMRGRRYKRIVISESAHIPTLKDLWERECAATLLDLRGSALFESSPCGQNYHAELHDKGKDPRNRDWVSFRIPTYENPILSREGIDNMREVMDEMSFAQEILAEFTSRTGAVFPKFRYETHVEERDIDHTTPISVGIDFGWHWFVAGLWTIHNDEVYLFDELVLHEHGTRDALTKLANTHVVGTGRTVREAAELIAPDPSGEADSPRSAQDDISATREIFGFNKVEKNMSARHRDIEWGCARIRDLIMTASGRIRLKVHPRCKYHLKCLTNYHYPERRDGQPTPTKPEKDGTHDHGIDEIRYLLIQAVFKRLALQ